MPTLDQTATVHRTFRAAIRLGDDFVTLEETITLPLHASDEDVQQAVALGWRIYDAQREALDLQVAPIKAGAAPEPASEAQRKLIDRLTRSIGMSEDDVQDMMAKHEIPSWEALTKRQASAVIDDLKADKAAIDRGEAPAPAAPHQQPEPAEAPAPAADPEPTPKAPGRTDLARAREALAEAHRKVGIGETPVREVQIREPNAPATEAQLRAIVRAASAAPDRRLTALYDDLISIASGLEMVNLRNRDQVMNAGLSKGQASKLIGLLAEKAHATAA